MKIAADIQAITLDWAEMHFRLQDSDLLSSKPAKISSFSNDPNEPGTRPLTRGEALPKFYTQGKDRLHLGKTVLKRTQGGNRFYQDYYTIWHRNKKFGVMMANSRDKKLMPIDDIQLQVINNKLYEEGWLQDLQEITTNMNAKWHNFTRLDIAVDGGNFLQLESLWKSKKIIKAGRAAVNTYYTGKGVVNGFYIGMSQSKKKVKVYNKSLELKKSNKLYIERFWKANGIDTTAQVERLELTMRNEESKKYKDIDWTQLDRPDHLASIMRSNFEKFCDFRIPGQGKNISRAPRVELVNWDQFAGASLPKDSTRPTTEIFSAKVTIKKLFEVHCITGHQLYYDIAFEVSINSDLVEWFTKMQPHWRDDVKLKTGENKDGVISDSWIHNFKHYNPGQQITIFDPDEIPA